MAPISSPGQCLVGKFIVKYGFLGRVYNLFAKDTSVEIKTISKRWFPYDRSIAEESNQRRTVLINATIVGSHMKTCKSFSLLKCF